MLSTARCTHLDLNIGDVLDELGAMLCLHLLSPLAKLQTGRGLRTRAEEVRLHDGCHIRRRHIAIEHLHAVVPTHAALGHAAAHEHHVALVTSATQPRDVVHKRAQLASTALGGDAGRGHAAEAEARFGGRAEESRKDKEHGCTRGNNELRA